MSQRSFFHLNTPQPPPRPENPVDELSVEEFDTFCTEAEPIFDVLVEALNAYSEQHPAASSLMACFIAVDMLRDMLKADLREAEAEA
jgi:hypothetical protein